MAHYVEKHIYIGIIYSKSFYFYGGFMKKNIHVVGAVIIENGNILCAQRGPSKALPFKWEFPGGKINLLVEPSWPPFAPQTLYL